MIGSFLIYARVNDSPQFQHPRVPHHPAKADAPLVVDSYTHLACSLSFQQFEAISRRITQVLDRRSGIQLAQLAERPHLHFARELAARLALPDTFGFLAVERSDH
jgi:hypothetical protein